MIYLLINRKRHFFLVVFIGACVLGQKLLAQGSPVSTLPSTDSIASGFYSFNVISNQDIRRAGVTNLPEALRLAMVLEVAQQNLRDWSVSIRGFARGPLVGGWEGSNKLLVMIDGRPLNSTLTGTVFWDATDLILDDVDRIEIIDGPYQTPTGLTAMNGAINIITKKATETAGLHAEAGIGSLLRTYGSVRSGGRSGKLSYRVFTDYSNRENTTPRYDTMLRHRNVIRSEGFRFDYDPSSTSTLSIEGGSYAGNDGDSATIRTEGEFVSGRWTDEKGPRSGYSAEATLQRSWRSLRKQDFSDDQYTTSLDLARWFPLGRRHFFTSGVRYNGSLDHVRSSALLAFYPSAKIIQSVHLFARDEIRLNQKSLALLLASNLGRCNYTSALVYQSTARLQWIPGPTVQCWLAFTEGRQALNRSDVDESTFLAATPATSLKPERSTDMELGLRYNPRDPFGASFTTFFSHYGSLRSLDWAQGVPQLYSFGTENRARSWGLEIWGHYDPGKSLHLRVGYLALTTNIWSIGEKAIAGTGTEESIAPAHQGLFSSGINIGNNLIFTAILRYVDTLPATIVSPEIPSYLSGDANLAFFTAHIGLSLTGQNLLQKEHAEFGPSQIPRSIFLRFEFRL